MTTLQKLLNLGLVDIGSDDSRFDKMKSAASALVTKFKEEPELLIPATLIALDDDVDEDDPMFAFVEDLVIVEWKTLRNIHMNRPRELLRSIIIDAMATAADGNAEVSGVIWNTAVSPMQHGQVSLGTASPILEEIFKQAFETAETEAITRAGLSTGPSKKPKKRKVMSGEVALNIKGDIKDEEILNDVARAAGPQYPQGQALPDDPNPNWPQTNQPAWSQQFTPRMTAALVKAINLGTTRLAESLGKNLVDYLGAIEKRLSDQLREAERLQNVMSQAHESSRMRLDVLWWSESLYSPSLNECYRNLPLHVAAVAAAVDLASIVPALAPVSVCYVLGETMLRLCQILDADENQQIVTYLDRLVEEKVDFGEAFPSSTTNNVRLPLLDLVGEAASGSAVSSDVLRSRARVDGALGLSAADFSMWIFRDLQACRLIKELR